MTQDVIVIGAGIIGLATAERLLTQGATVTILERNQVGKESSWAGGGILSPLCPWDYPDEVTNLTRYSASLFPAWVAALHQTTGINCEYETSGILVLPPYDIQMAQHWCATHGMETKQNLPPHSVFANNELGIYGNKTPEHSLFLPEIAQVRSPRLLHALHNQVTALGGQIVEHCSVSNIAVKNERVQSLATTGGKFNANRYIVSAGAWSKEILGQYALNLDIKPIRGQMLLFKFDTPPIRTIFLQNDLYIIPRQDGHLLIGSTLEDVGFDKRTTETVRNDLFKRAQAVLPFLRDRQILQHWAGLRPASPHNIPTIGKHPFLENLYINSGHFRYGVTMAPASAEILLNEMTGNPQPIDTNPYQTGWRN